MKFEFLYPAAREFEEAIRWYAQRSSRACEGFRETVRSAIDLAISKSGSAGILVGKRTKKAPMKLPQEGAKGAKN